MFDYQYTHGQYQSIFIEYGLKSNSPFVSKENYSWSVEAAVEVGDEMSETKIFHVGRERLFKGARS